MMLKRRRTHVCTQGSNWWIGKQMFSFMFPGFMQPVRKEENAGRVRERMRGVFRDGSTHVARRLWSACSNLEDIAHEWPTTTIRRPLAKPLTNLDQSSSPDLISPLPHVIQYPINIPSRAGKWLLRKILSVQFLATICPVSTSSSQSFVFHKSVMEFVY